MKVEDLMVGGLYGDKDGVDMLFFIREYNDYLSEFVSAEWDEEKSEYKKTEDKRLLTKSEVKNLVKW